LFSTYSSLFTARGAAAFSSTGFLARMPISMLGIGTLLLVSGTTGTYALAGVLSGAITFAGALGQPQIARLVDRLGQARVLRPALLAHGVFLAGMIAAVRLDWPVWTWFGFGLLAGATLPSIGSMVRARWTHVIHDNDRRQTAFAFESVLDEVIFVIGPPLATFLATSVNPAAGLVAALCFAIGGGFLFAAQRATQPPVQSSDDIVARRDVVTRGLIAICVTFLGAGAVFGSVEVVVVAFADERGQRGLAGLVLACYAAGSLISGLVYGARRWRRRLSDRFVLAAIFFGMATVLPLGADSIAVLSPLIFLTGLAIAPVLISGMSLVERLVPRRALTEGLTWSITALTVGVTAGAAIAGPLVDNYGSNTAFRLPAGAAILTAIVAVGVRPWLRAAPSADPDSDGPDDSADRRDGREVDCPVPGATTPDAHHAGARGRMDL
jgi:MFS family permease